MENDNENFINDEVMGETIEYDFKLKASVFFKRKFPCHVTLNSGSWYNGKIIELSADFFILKDRKKGKILIFFQEIYKMDIFHEEKEEKKRGNDNGKRRGS
jgi:hypothetical protein